MSSWLVNTTGQKDRWIPADLFQEHNNLLTKTIHSAKGSNASWEFINEAVSPNISVFSDIASQVEKEFNVPYSGSNHATVSATPDIENILVSIRENGILSKDRRPCGPHVTNTPLVKNLYEEGMVKLGQGNVNKFINCSNLFQQRTVPDPNDDDMEGEVDMVGEIDLEFDTDEYIQRTAE